MGIEEERTSSLQELSKLKVKDLKEILRENGEPTSGKIANQIVRCEVIQRRKESQQQFKDTTSTNSEEISETQRSTQQVSSTITYKTIAKEAEVKFVSYRPSFNYTTILLFLWTIMRCSKSKVALKS